MLSDLFPILASRLLPDVVGCGAPPDVYLTFDDGPDPRFTPKLLEILDKHGCKATFFVTGKKVERHPDIVRAALQAGHAIGAHGYDHKSFWFRKRRSIQEDINRSIGAIADITGSSPRLFRPPYGHICSAQLSHTRDLGIKTVLWSRSAGDYLATPPTLIEQRISRRSRPGDIILMHDGMKYADNTLMALPAILEAFRARSLATRPLYANLICVSKSDGGEHV